VLDLLLSAALLVQDPVALVPSLLAAQNEHVRVLRARYAPGEGLAMHKHPARVVVFLTDARLEVTVPDGSNKVLERKAGGAEATPPTKHAVRNVGEKKFEAVEIELLAPTTARPLGDAVAEDPKHPALVLENESVRVLRTTIPPGETAPMHGHGERVTVILSGDRMRTQREGGEPSESDVKTGDVSIAGPVRHTATNVGKVVHDAITVELKPR
jgi:quercetin dioxygenase-like cupin family protein